MWSPNFVQVLVRRAKGLNIKGKNGTNDAYVIIGLGKEKYQTTIKEKATENVEWGEQCELAIPTNGNKAEVILSVLHRNFIGVDEFLGMVTIPLRDFDVYERHKTMWLPLKCKPNQDKTDYRGELEVSIAFTIKSEESNSENSKGEFGGGKGKNDKVLGSLSSLNKAASSLGGSLLSLRAKDKKNLAKFAKSVSGKVDKAKRSLSKKNISLREKENEFEEFEIDSEDRKYSFRRSGSDRLYNRDPGVNSDEEDDMFKFDELSHKSSASSLNNNNNNNNNNKILGHSSSSSSNVLGSKTTTPLSGSLENFEGFRKSETSKGPGTPKSATLGRLSQREFHLSTSSKIVEEEESSVLDEWEAKLLGKKGVIPYKSPKVQEKEKEEEQQQLSSVSMLSQPSFVNSSVGEKTPPTKENEEVIKSSHRRPSSSNDNAFGSRKIISVGSDFESCSSPDTPGSPIDNDLAFESEESTPNKKVSHGSLSQIKQSCKNLINSGSLLNIHQLSSKGFRDKKSSSNKDSLESIGSQHSVAHSDGSVTNNSPPFGTRVVLGRETTPTPNPIASKIPKEIWNRYEGQSREDLIEMIVHLQSSVESHARKLGDLEEYIDGLLTKVIKTAPSLLQKDINEALKGRDALLCNK